MSGEVVGPMCFARRSAFRGILLGCTIAALGMPRAAQAEIDVPSLGWVPADAAIYTTSLRIDEQIESLVASNAWNKLKGLPLVQQVMATAQQQMEDPAGQLYVARQVMRLPENQQLLALLQDMVSHEIVFYGSQEIADLTELAILVNNAVQYGPMMAVVSGDLSALNNEQYQAQLALAALNEHQEMIQVPEFVMAFRVSDLDRARTQLQRLAIIVETALMQVPELTGRFSTVDIAGEQFLTLELDGELVPWEEIDWEELEEETGSLDVLEAKLKTLTFTLALGIRDGYVVASVGPSWEHLEQWDSRESLGTREELHRLDHLEGKAITSVAYVNGEFLQGISGGQRDLESLKEAAEAGIPQAVENGYLTEEQGEHLRTEIDGILDSMIEVIPEPGTLLVAEYRTDYGYASDTYNWGTNPLFEASEPLDLLKHVGGNPLFAQVGRSVNPPELLDGLGRIVRLAKWGIEEIGLPQIPDSEEREQAEQAIAILFPALEKLGDVLRNKLFPAMSPGESAIVLDAKLESEQPSMFLPPPDGPLGLPELGIVCETNDGQAVQESLGEMREIINAALAGMHEVAPDEIPEIQIPKPSSEPLAGGTDYWYPWEQYYIDERVMPNLGVSDSVVVFSLSKAHTERLFKEDSPSARFLAKAAELPLGQVVFCDWEASLHIAEPWVRYAITQAANFGMLEDFASDPNQLEAMMSQLGTVMDVLRTLKTITARTYIEDDVFVTHTDVVIEDLED